MASLATPTFHPGDHPLGRVYHEPKSPRHHTLPRLGLRSVSWGTHNRCVPPQELPQDLIDQVISPKYSPEQQALALDAVVEKYDFYNNSPVLPHSPPRVDKIFGDYPSEAPAPLSVGVADGGEEEAHDRVEDVGAEQGEEMMPELCWDLDEPGAVPRLIVTDDTSPPDQPSTERPTHTEQPPHTEQTPHTEQPSHAEQTPATEQTLPTEQTPHTEQTLPTEQPPHTEQTSHTEQTLRTEQAPHAEQTLPREQTPTAEQTHTAEQQTTTEQTPTAEQQTTTEQTPTAEQQTTTEQTPTAEQTPTTEQQTPDPLPSSATGPPAEADVTSRSPSTDTPGGPSADARRSSAVTSGDRVERQTSEPKISRETDDKKNSSRPALSKRSSGKGSGSGPLRGGRGRPGSSRSSGPTRTDRSETVPPVKTAWSRPPSFAPSKPVPPEDPSNAQQRDLSKTTSSKPVSPEDPVGSAEGQSTDSANADNTPVAAPASALAEPTDSTPNTDVASTLETSENPQTENVKPLETPSPEISQTDKNTEPTETLLPENQASVPGNEDGDVSVVREQPDASKAIGGQSSDPKNTSQSGEQPGNASSSTEPAAGDGKIPPVSSPQAPSAADAPQENQTPVAQPSTSSDASGKNVHPPPGNDESSVQDTTDTSELTGSTDRPEHLSPGPKSTDDTRPPSESNKDRDTGESANRESLQGDGQPFSEPPESPLVVVQDQSSGTAGSSAGAASDAFKSRANDSGSTDRELENATSPSSGVKASDNRRSDDNEIDSVTTERPSVAAGPSLLGNTEKEGQQAAKLKQREEKGARAKAKAELDAGAQEGEDETNADANQEDGRIASAPKRQSSTTVDPSLLGNNADDSSWTPALTSKEKRKLKKEEEARAKAKAEMEAGGQEEQPGSQGEDETNADAKQGDDRIASALKGQSSTTVDPSLLGNNADEGSWAPALTSKEKRKLKKEEEARAKAKAEMEAGAQEEQPGSQGEDETNADTKQGDDRIASALKGQSSTTVNPSFLGNTVDEGSWTPAPTSKEMKKMKKEEARMRKAEMEAARLRDLEEMKAKMEAAVANPEKELATSRLKRKGKQPKTQAEKKGRARVQNNAEGEEAGDDAEEMVVTTASGERNGVKGEPSGVETAGESEKGPSEKEGQLHAITITGAVGDSLDVKESSTLTLPTEGDSPGNVTGKTGEEEATNTEDGKTDALTTLDVQAEEDEAGDRTEVLEAEKGSEDKGGEGEPPGAQEKEATVKVAEDATGDTEAGSTIDAGAKTRPVITVEVKEAAVDDELAEGQNDMQAETEKTVAHDNMDGSKPITETSPKGPQPSPLQGSANTTAKSERQPKALVQPSSSQAVSDICIGVLVDFSDSHVVGQSTAAPKNPEGVLGPPDKQDETHVAAPHSTSSLPQNVPSVVSPKPTVPKLNHDNVRAQQLQIPSRSWDSTSPFDASILSPQTVNTARPSEEHKSDQDSLQDNWHDIGMDLNHGSQIGAASQPSASTTSATTHASNPIASPHVLHENRETSETSSGLIPVFVEPHRLSSLLFALSGGPSQDSGAIEVPASRHDRRSSDSDFVVVARDSVPTSPNQPLDLTSQDTQRHGNTSPLRSENGNQLAQEPPSPNSELWNRCQKLEKTVSDLTAEILQLRTKLAAAAECSTQSSGGVASSQMRRSFSLPRSKFAPPFPSAQ